MKTQTKTEKININCPVCDGYGEFVTQVDVDVFRTEPCYSCDETGEVPACDECGGSCYTGDDDDECEECCGTGVEDFEDFESAIKDHR